YRCLRRTLVVCVRSCSPSTSRDWSDSDKRNIMLRQALFLLLIPAFVTHSQTPVPPKPQDTEVWTPVPKVVTPGHADADPPSDAIVLFDGRNLDQWVSARAG